MFESFLSAAKLDASSVGIIGGADGPTAIFVTGFVTGPVGDLMNALSLAAKGMAGILAVMAFIALIVWALPHLTAALEKKDNENNTDAR